MVGLWAGIEKVGNNDAYKIKVTSPSGRTSTEYYDATTGYLVKEDKTQKYLAAFLILENSFIRLLKLLLSLNIYAYTT